MDLRENEKILKVYHHHYTPFIWISLKIIAYFVPLYLFIYVSKNFLSQMNYFWLNVAFFILFSLVFLYIASMYWMDQFIITDQRIIFSNYKFITVREESQASIKDIQDIMTKEKGILSRFRWLDYGLLRIETAASVSSIVFENAPDPEGIRHYIFEIRKSYKDKKND